jgi:hypothetical protein
VEARDEAAVSIRNVATRSGEPTPGSGFPELGAPKRWETPREEVVVEVATVGRSDGDDGGDEGEVLEGGCKAMSGDTPEGNTNRSAARRKTPRSRPQGKRTKVEPRSQTSSYVGL